MTKQLNIHCLQHIAFETPGYVLEWTAQNGHTVTYTKFYDGEPIYPALETFEWLLILGGAMACYEEDSYPFLIEEKRFIRQCIEAGKIITGICLGSQLLAECMGAKVYPGNYKEIGFLPVALTSEGLTHPILQELPPVMELFQWHGDTFDLPAGATLLASSEACKNQAFIKEKCVGIQFHPEANEVTIKSMIEADRHELVQAPYVHSEEQVLNDLQKLKLSRTYLFRLLDRIAHL